MSRLPASLAPWSEALAVLDARLAVDLGPLVRRVDDLVRRLDTHVDGAGEPDGFDGTSSRGLPERMLVEEWLIASEVPLEFLRRAASHELRYSHLARREPAPTGQVLALVDCGPEQLGVGRLVQLAAVVVLHRRASDTGTPLVLVDARTGARAEGPLERVLPRWLTWRSVEPHDPAAVVAVLDGLDASDQAWVLAGPTLAAAVAPHRRVLTSRVVAWTEDRAGAVEIRVGGLAGSAVTVDVPVSGVAIAALRGEGLGVRRRRAAVGAGGSGPGTSAGHGAAFTSAAAALLWHGERPDVFVRLAVPDHPAEPDRPEPGRPEPDRPQPDRPPPDRPQPGRPRRYVLPGTLLAAAVLGRRTVALVTDGDRVWPHVVGRELRAIEAVETTLADLGLDAAAVDAIAGQPVRALHLWSRSLLVDLPSGWWVVDDEACVHRPFVAIAPGEQLDQPRFSDVGSRHVLLGQQGWVGTSDDGSTWHLEHRAGRASCDVTTDDHAIGLTVVDAEPCLVTVSRGGAGRLVRLAGPTVSRTLTRWSGDESTYSVHPTRPWLARTTATAVEVGDLRTGERLVRVGLEP